MVIVGPVAWRKEGRNLSQRRGRYAKKLAPQLIIAHAPAALLARR